MLSFQDRPGQPEGPLKISEVTKETCVVTWKAPLDNGGVSVDKYIIDRLDVARGEWTPTGEVNGETTTLRIIRLTAGKEYMFRVRAVNKEGESDALETTASMLAKNSFDEPSAPGRPEITDWDKSHAELEWQAPVMERDHNRTDPSFCVSNLGERRWCTDWEVRHWTTRERTWWMATGVYLDRSRVWKEINECHSRAPKSVAVTRREAAVVFPKAKNTNFVLLLWIKVDPRSPVNHRNWSWLKHVSVRSRVSYHFGDDQYLFLYLTSQTSHQQDELEVDYSQTRSNNHIRRSLRWWTVANDDLAEGDNCNDRHFDFIQRAAFGIV